MFSLRTQAVSLFVGQNFDSLAEDLQKNQINLATGYRIHSAMDDAAGLQIATRLDAESRGQCCAMQNAETGISYLQTAESVLSEVSNNLLRMRDLAVSAANGIHSDDDKKAFTSEYMQLNKQIHSMMNNAKFGGESLFGTDSQLYKGDLKLQIGEASEQTVTVDEMSSGAKEGLKQLFTFLNKIQLSSINDSKLLAHNPLVMMSPSYPGRAAKTSSATTPAKTPISTSPSTHSYGELLDHLEQSIHAVSHIRSSLGGVANGLQAQYQNLSQMRDAMLITKGRIVDADYAEETAKMLANKMLMQSSGSMVRESKSLNQLTGSLIQMI